MSQEKERALAKEVWITSTNEEVFYGGEEYDSKEAAIEGGKEEYGGEPFFVGRREEIQISSLVSCAIDTLIENILDQVYDKVGDVADGWLSNFSKEDTESIEKFVVNIIETKYPPSFYAVEDSEGIEAEEAEDE